MSAVTPPRTFLLVASAAERAEALRVALAHEPGARVAVAKDRERALEMARRESPIGIFVEAGEDPRGALELSRALRSAHETAASLLVLVVDQGRAEFASVAWTMGVDQVLQLPIGTAELHDALAAAFHLADLRDALDLDEKRIASLGEQLEESRRETGELRAELDHHAERMHAMLFKMLELGIPGAIDRGAKIAELAMRMAARFSVPETLLPDLDRAARLHELGRLVVASEIGREAGASSGHAWRYSQSTVAILQKIEAFEEASDLIGSIYENWDGTGRPGHWQAGQIPLRCRILRVLVDYFAELETDRGRDPQRLIEFFEERAGTHYDPLVVVQLKAVLAERGDQDPRGDTQFLSVIDLRVGMVLAEDLYADSGLKLLSSGTTISPATLEIILRRHRAEPILQGAAVRRSAA